MANIIANGGNIPPVVVSEMFNAVRGKSALAKISDRMPVAFNGSSEFVFNMDSEADIVAENGAKANGGATIAAVKMAPIKIEYVLRISDEFRYAAEEIQLQYLQAFADGFAKKVARGLDIMAFHGVNPRTGLTAASLANKNFDDLITQNVTFNASTPDDNITTAIVDGEVVYNGGIGRIV